MSTARDLRAGLFALAAGLALATQAAAADPAVLTGGQSLVPGGLALDGETLLTIGHDSAGCWRLRLLAPRGEEWAEVAAAEREPPPEGACARAVATMSADGSQALAVEYAQDRVTLLRRQRSDLAVEGELAIEGLKGFDHPPPPAAALTRDGRIALVGAANYDCKLGFPGERCGTAILFRRTSEGWRRLATLPYPEPRVFAVDFGTVAALSADGGVAVVGGPGHAGDPGILYVYGRRGERWIVDAPLAPDDSSESAFGQSVAISADGSLIAVGGEQRVYLFVRRGDRLVKAERLPAPDETAGGFGIAVALSADGMSLLVGAPRAPCGGQSRCGAAYLYRYEQGGFQLQRRLEAPTPVPMTDFGHVVALDATGSVIAVQGHRPYVFRR